MTEAMKKALEVVQALSTEEQLEVVEIVQATAAVNEDVEPEIKQAWMTEVRRRKAEVERGDVKMVPWEEAEARIFATD